MAKDKLGVQRVTDQRFAAVHTDPRFQRVPRAKQQVTIDDRFKGMLSDPKFQSSAAVDKRGRKVKSKGKGDNLRKYYKLTDEAPGDAAQEADPKRLLPQHDEAQQPLTDQQVEAQLPDSQQPGSRAPKARAPKGRATPQAPQQQAAPVSSEDVSSEDAASKRWARLRGLGDAPQSSSDDVSSDEGAEGPAALAPPSSSEDDAEEWGPGAMAANPDEVIPEAEETSRLAVMDLDWDHVSAEDILAILRSFLQRGQAIQRVAVYPSDYGTKRMAEEAVMGPRLRPSKDEKAAAARQLQADGSDAELDGAPELEAALPPENSSSDEEGADGSEDGSLEGSGPASEGGSDLDLADLNGGLRGSDAGSESGEEVNPRTLAKYERSRLRYFYGVVECNSVAAAAHLYEECDGLEFERSSNRLDLRYIPQTQSFEGRTPRDEAFQVSGGYQAPDFHTKALQHSRVQLTWDADEQTRARGLSRRLNADQLREDDFKAYLASSGSEEDGPSRDPAKYQALLSQAAGRQRAGGKAWGAADESDDESPDEATGLAAARPEDQPGSLDMQVTFGGGLEALSSRLAEKATGKGKKDTLFEEYMRRRSEKKRAAKSRRQRGSSDEEDDDAAGGGPVPDDVAEDPFFQHGDDPFSDPFFKEDAQPAQVPAAKDTAAPEAKAEKAERALKRAEAAEKRRQAAELELLLLEEGRLSSAAPVEQQEDGKAVKKGRKARLKAKRAAKQRERQAGSDDDDIPAADGFKVNVGDPRFQGLFTSQDFAMDPTDPQFSKAPGAPAILAEAARRKGSALPGAQPGKGAIKRKPEAAPQHQDAGVRSMVSALKIKAQRTAGRPVKWQPHKQG